MKRKWDNILPFSYSNMLHESGIKLVPLWLRLWDLIWAFTTSESIYHMEVVREKREGISHDSALNLWKPRVNWWGCTCLIGDAQLAAQLQEEVMQTILVLPWGLYELVKSLSWIYGSKQTILSSSVFIRDFEEKKTGLTDPRKLKSHARQYMSPACSQMRVHNLR